MDLSTDPSVPTPTASGDVVITVTPGRFEAKRVQVDCEVAACMRRITFIVVADGVIADAQRRFFRRSPALSGRHRLRVVEGRHGEVAYSFECGCGHKRTISGDGLRRKLLQATEPRIRL